MGHVDRVRWAEEVRRPDWYLRLRPEYEALLAEARRSAPERARQIADDVYSFFEDGLGEGTIAIGATGPDWDRERQPIDTVVVHHTSLPPGITAARIEAIHLTRIYARYYAEPAPAEAHIRGLPIHSGHWHGGRQVFYAYHWLVRADGSSMRLLDDNETGWHAGDWATNCRSIGICLDGGFEEDTPSAAMIGGLRELVGRYQGIATVAGHREINPKTTCPGKTFSEWRIRITASNS